MKMTNPGEVGVLSPAWPGTLSHHQPKTVARRPGGHIQLHDIRRRTDDEGLVPQILSGLESEEKELPSLLLWNERGLQLFDAILDSNLYYPATREPELLSTSVQNLAYSISSGEKVIELGAGNMRKTALILRTLELQRKNVEYFALDVSRASLRSSLRELLRMFSGSAMIKIRGLLGTYEDCASWLQCNHDQRSRITLLWLGNSIANFTPTEASELISRFFRPGESSPPPIQMVLGVDGCQNQEEIAQSYESHRSRDFILNGLDHANQLLSSKVFKAADWEFHGRWNPEKYMHESFYVPLRDVCLPVEGKIFNMKKGEPLRAISSGKWPCAKVTEICKEAGTQVVDSWMNQQNSYGIYVLRGVSQLQTSYEVSQQNMY